MLRVLVALCAIISTAHAAPSEERMKELLAFAGTAMGVRYHDVELPTIKYRTTEQMQIKVIGEERLEQINNMPGTRAPEPRAMYRIETQTMYLNEETDYTDPENEFELVHEFVHHLQAVHDHYSELPCIQAAEEEAYRVSNLWVMATGRGEIKDAMTVHLISRCGADW